MHTDNSKKLGAGALLWAIGRYANTEGFGLEELGVKLNKKGEVITYAGYQEPNVPGILSIGDFQSYVLLTSAMVTAGRRLSSRLFGPPTFKNDKLDYENIVTVVFSE